MNSLSERLAAWLRPLVEVKPAERFKTLVMFFYFFLTIALIYILKPVRNSLFIGELGSQNLRYVYMGEGIFLIFVASAYVYLSKKIPKNIFFVSCLLFFASNLVLFWFLFKMEVPYLSAYFYIWVASFSITSTTQFWILANDIFASSEAKRLFGLIISGGSAGGVIGGIFTNRAVQYLRAEDMMLVAAAVVVMCAFLVGVTWKHLTQAQSAVEKPVNAEHASAETKKDSGSKILLGSSYLIMLALIVIIAKMSSTIVDNQFSRMVELNILGKEARTAFFAGFMAWLNVASFVMQLIVTSFCFRWLGVAKSLWILPLGLVLFSWGTLLYPILAAGIFLRLFESSVSYSVQQAGKEVLFLPIDSQTRYRVKPLIDMLGFRVAKSLSGVYIAVAAPFLGLPDEKLGVLILFLIPAWLFILWRMKRGYASLW